MMKSNAPPATIVGWRRMERHTGLSLAGAAGSATSGWTTAIVRDSNRHPRASGGPGHAVRYLRLWIPASGGMTKSGDAASSIPDARVEQRIAEIDHQIDHHI